MDSTITDENLMLAYREGDYDAFASLYARHKAAVYRFYQRQAGESFAEELLQDAFMRLVSARTRYQPSARFKTFLWTLVRSVLIDHYRKQGRSLPASDMDAVDGDVPAPGNTDPAAIACTGQRIEMFLALVSQLPGEQREAFLLKEEGGLSVPEIAEVVGIGAEAVKSRLRYAVKKLRAGMEVMA